MYGTNPISLPYEDYFLRPASVQFSNNIRMEYSRDIDLFKNLAL